jgi:hypothetical protein
MSDELERDPDEDPTAQHLKLHSVVSHGRMRAEGGGWISLGVSSVLNPPQPREEPWA